MMLLKGLTSFVEFGPGVHDLAELSPQGKSQVEQILAALGAPAWKDRVVVVESTLSPGGSIYRVRAEAALAA